MFYADVALSVSVDKSFTYAVPEALAGDVAVGKRVLVPFGKRVLTGYVTALVETAAVDKVRDIKDVLDAAPLFNEKGLRFLKWMSSYYLAPLGQVLGLIHPPGADIRGRRFFKLAPAALAGGVAERGLAGELLDFLRNSEREVLLTVLLKSFKGRAIYSVLARLVEKGLINEEVKLTGGSHGRREKLVSPVLSESIEPPGDSTPAQKRLYELLVKKGETSLAELSKELGNASAAVKRLEEKGLVTVREVRNPPDPMGLVTGRAARHEPNDEQRAAIKAITGVIGKEVFSPFLLYGVTGSGKTLVYLNVLEEVVSSGGRALFLVPEITLTPWPAAYLKERFPGRVAVAHSGLTAGERIDEWRRIAGGRADIIVGTRSALFSPVKDLSLIIVDEEHDPSYKQEEGVRYNGRDAAIVLGKHIGATVLLGSATPSVETFYNSKTGKITPLFLTKRVEDRPMPEVEVIDMRGKKGVIISERLSALMKEALDNKNQSMLFLNRRGFSGCLVCRDCGHTFSCPNCSVSLTLHKRPAEIKCHYPGVGTEKVEEEVKRTLPGARVVRMDRDTARKKGAVKSMIDDMEKKRADVLVGTQMVSKGHHFPGITLAGIISGDTSLNIPDFRSPERTFQLVTQAAGRAGRGLVPGTVVIQ
ncbi:MAG: primosomal protein N', partial [Thermodesulfobacteriota bacterium]